MRRTNLDRLRAAAERRHIRSTRPNYQDRHRAERRAEAELLNAIATGAPLPSRAYPRPLSDYQEQIRAEVLDGLDARRDDLIATAAMLRAAGHENDLTRDIEDAGLMPKEPNDDPEIRGA